MSSKLDELRRRAEEAARQLDEKFEIKTRLDQGTRAASGALRKGAEAATSTIDAAREEVTRLNREHRVTERVTDTARRAADTADDLLNRSGIKEKAADAASGASQKASEVADDAKQAASDLFGEARRFYDNASGAPRASASAARLPSSLIGTLASARRWAKKNPGKAAVVSLAFIAGTRAGAAFSSLDVVLLGAGGAGNWFFHSAITPYALRKLSQKYEAYLKKQ